MGRRRPRRPSLRRTTRKTTTASACDHTTTWARDPARKPECRESFRLCATRGQVTDLRRDQTIRGQLPSGLDMSTSYQSAHIIRAMGLEIRKGWFMLEKIKKKVGDIKCSLGVRCPVYTGQPDPLLC